MSENDHILFTYKNKNVPKSKYIDFFFFFWHLSAIAGTNTSAAGGSPGSVCSVTAAQGDGWGGGHTHGRKNRSWQSGFKGPVA